MAKRSAFRDSWKDYLSFSKRERRGITALVLIIFSQIIVLVYLAYFPSNESAQDFSQFKKDIDAFYASTSTEDDSLNTNDRQSEQPDKKIPDLTKVKIELFAFNPNNLATEDWQRLGFSDKQIKVIKHYEEKGGKFYSKERRKD